MTEFEKKGLRSLGWKDGDPIPPDLSRQITQAQAEALAESNTPFVAAGTTGAAMPPEVPLSSLPREKQMELLAAIRDSKSQMEQFNQQQSAQVPGADPTVNAAIQDLLRTPLIPPSSLIEDDLRQVNVEVKPRPSAPAPASAPTPAPSPPTTSDDVGDDAGGAPNVKVCPHCGFDKDHHDVVASESDKLQWLVAQEGQLRFTKTYQIYGGRINVTFRNLTSRETDMCWRQMAIDAKKDLDRHEPGGGDMYWRSVMTYRMAIAIERFWSAGTGPIEFAPVEEIQIDAESCPPPNTAVYAMMPFVTSQVLATDSLRRVVGDLHTQFQRLVEHLEAHANDDSFWKAIEGHS